MTELSEPAATGQTRLSEVIVKTLPIPPTGNKVHYFAGAILQGQPAPRGFGVRVTAAGVKSFVLNYRIKGREYRYTIGRYPEWSALRAVRQARELRQRIDRGENPLDDRAPAPMVKTVAEVLDDFMSRYARNKDRPLRSADEYESAFSRLVRPAIGKLGIYDVRRSNIVEMLDKIEDKSGPVMADRTLAYLRKAFNWHATRDDRFVPPIVRGMARTKARERARERILSDDEVRIIWPKLFGTFGGIVKLLLLTAQRRLEVAHIQRAEITDGVWIIPAERYKSKRANSVPLSAAALAIIETQPKFENCDYVFTGRTQATPFSGFGKAKAALDEATGIFG
jgi:Arm DNA-binding domain